MEARELYGRLKSDFIKEGITDYDWASRMPELNKYLYDDFKQSGMGLMCDFTDKLKRFIQRYFFPTGFFLKSYLMVLQMQ